MLSQETAAQNPQILIWPVDRLIPYARNPRKNDAAVDRMCSSIREFGFKVPCLVRSSGELVDGHLRLKAAKKLGVTEVRVILCDERTPAQIKAFRLLVNRSATWADFDEELLALELEDLKASEFDLSLTGFDDEELARLLADENAGDGFTDEDAVPDVAEAPVTLPGDLWRLSRDHKLLVGDATDPADVERLMAGDSADLVFIDTPYNTDYEGYTEEHLTIQNDRMSGTDFKQFLESVFRSCRAAIKPGASLYVCHSWRRRREFQNALEAAGLEVRCQIIWAKNTFASIFYCHVAGQSDAWYGDKTQSTLWQENKTGGESDRGCRGTCGGVRACGRIVEVFGEVR